jgi:hypothetical protein
MPPAAQAAVTISTAATSNMSCVSGVCTPTAANAVLNVSDLTSMLANGPVTVNTGTGSLAQQVEDIVVAATFNWASANALTLDAYRSVTFTAPVAVNGSAPVSLVTNDGGSSGNLSFVSAGSLSFLGTANGLTINGKVFKLENSISRLAAAIKHKPTGRYALSASYDASGDGTYKSSPIPTKFNGTFNGLGNAISNLTMDGKGKDNLDLFAYIDSAGAVNSLRVMNVNIDAEAVFGGGDINLGALAGTNYGSLFNDVSNGHITIQLQPSSAATVGGLVGGNLGSVAYSSSSVAIEVEGNPNAIGFFGAGLVGASDGTISQSFATGSISGTAKVLSQVGGLCGTNSGTIANSYAEGAIALPRALYAGGFLGQTYTAATASYSTGAITGGSGDDVGGFVGIDSSDGAFSLDYWDITTSGITNLGQGAGSPANDPGITGETTAQLQSALPTGFDPTIWAESPSINNGLPYLIANPPQ